MNDWKKVIVLSGLYSCALSVNAFASADLETGSSLADISVALNNYYTGSTEPEKWLASSYSDVQDRPAQSNTAADSAKSGSGSDQGSGNEGSGQSDNASGDTAKTKVAQETISSPKSSTYDNITVSEINGTVGTHAEANTSSGVTSKINNGYAAAILNMMGGGGGKRYKIQSGSITGCIKTDYFVTEQQAEAGARQMGTTYGTIVGAPSLRLRQNPDMEGRTLTLLSESTRYVVTGEEGDFLKAQVDPDLGGYAFKEYTKTSVEFNKAVSMEEEKAKTAEEAKRREDADKALKILEDAKKAGAAKKTMAATTKAQKTTETPVMTAPKKKEVKGTGAVTTIATNPGNGKGDTMAAPTMARVPEAMDSKGPGSSSGTFTEMASVTCNAVMAYTRQFLDNPYMYGGTSLTNGVGYSGFTQSVFAHFGISTGKNSRNQATRGKSISVSDAKPGDLLFYVSGDCINHVAIYIGGGQVIHASNPTTGICITPANCRTPCKAVTFLG